MQMGNDAASSDSIKTVHLSSGERFKLNEINKLFLN